MKKKRHSFHDIPAKPVPHTKKTKATDDTFVRYIKKYTKRNEKASRHGTNLSEDNPSHLLISPDDKRQLMTLLKRSRASLYTAAGIQSTDKQIILFLRPFLRTHGKCLVTVTGTLTSRTDKGAVHKQFLFHNARILHSPLRTFHTATVIPGGRKAPAGIPIVLGNAHDLSKIKNIHIQWTVERDSHIQYYHVLLDILPSDNLTYSDKGSLIPLDCMAADCRYLYEKDIRKFYERILHICNIGTNEYHVLPFAGNRSDTSDFCMSYLGSSYHPNFREHALPAFSVPDGSRADITLFYRKIHITQECLLPLP